MSCAHPTLDLSRLSPELRDFAEPDLCEKCGAVRGFDLAPGWSTSLSYATSRMETDEPIYAKSRLPGLSPEGDGTHEQAGTKHRPRPGRRREQVATRAHEGAGATSDELARERATDQRRGKRVREISERERGLGIDHRDAAADWLRKHDPREAA
jgi:hypothetical protein